MWGTWSIYRYDKRPWEIMLVIPQASILLWIMLTIIITFTWKHRNIGVRTNLVKPQEQKCWPDQQLASQDLWIEVADWDQLRAVAAGLAKLAEDRTACLQKGPRIRGWGLGRVLLKLPYQKTKAKVYHENDHNLYWRSVKGVEPPFPEPQLKPSTAKYAMP